MGGGPGVGTGVGILWLITPIPPIDAKVIPPPQLSPVNHIALVVLAGNSTPLPPQPAPAEAISETLLFVDPLLL